MWSRAYENIACWIVGYSVGDGDPTIGPQVSDNWTTEPGLERILLAHDNGSTVPEPEWFTGTLRSDPFTHSMGAPFSPQ